MLALSGRGGSKRTSCASPEFTGPAATRSSICARARRAGSSSRGRCSTAPMPTTSPNLRALPLTRGLEGQIWNVADDEPVPPAERGRLCDGAPRPAGAPEEPFDEARLSSMTAEFYADNKRVSIAKAKTILGFVPAYPNYREGLRALAEAGEGRGA